MTCILKGCTLNSIEGNDLKHRVLYKKQQHYRHHMGKTKYNLGYHITLWYEFIFINHYTEPLHITGSYYKERCS